MLGSNPKVSVCVVAYNHERYIRQCLQSILSQEVDFPFEVIVGEDGSTDRTRAIIQEFVEQFPTVVKVIFHEHNVGATENYLATHRLAAGEYVCHCDGDDYWLSGKLKAQTALMDANPKIVQSWHRQAVVDQDSAEIGRFPKRFPDVFFRKPLTFNDLAHSYGLVGQHSSQMYRRSARSVYERDRPTIDYFFALDIASRGLSVYMPEFLGCYRVVAGGSVTQGTGGRNAVDVCVSDAVRYFANRFPDSSPAFKANVVARAFGGIVRRRASSREMLALVSDYPVSLASIVRSFFVFAAHKL